MRICADTIVANFGIVAHGYFITTWFLKQWWHFHGKGRAGAKGFFVVVG